MATPRKGKPETYDTSLLLGKVRLLPVEAAFLLGVAQRTVQRYMQEGRLEFDRTIGGHRRPLTASVKKHL